MNANVSIENSAISKEINKVIKPDQECGVMVTYYSSDGQISGQHYYSSDQPTFGDCQNYQAGIRRMLVRQGYVVEEQGAYISQ